MATGWGTATNVLARAAGAVRRRSPCDREILGSIQPPEKQRPEQIAAKSGERENDERKSAFGSDRVALRLLELSK